MATFQDFECEQQVIDFSFSPTYDASSFSIGGATEDTPEGEEGSPIYIQVLTKYGIPFSDEDGIGEGGTLPGVDLRNVDAFAAIRFSLAEAFTGGKWLEIYEDELGGTYLVDVLNPKEVEEDLPVRLSVPSTTVAEGEYDLVIVRGYDSPPQRFAGDPKVIIPGGSGPVNPSDPTGKVFTVDLSEDITSCVKTQLNKEVIKSFEDPVVQTPKGESAFELGPFETVLFHAIKIEGFPDDGSATYSFNEATEWYYKLPSLPNFSIVTDETEICLDGVLRTENVPVYSSKLSINVDSYTDRYGTEFPLATRPTKIVYTGYTINNIFVTGSTATGFFTVVYINPVEQFLSLSEGSQWTWGTSEDPEKSIIDIFYTIPDKFTPADWGLVLDAATGNQGAVSYRIANVNTLSANQEEVAGLQAGALPEIVSIPNVLGVLPANGGVGTLITQMWVGFTLARPSATVTAKPGFTGARSASDSLKVTYLPIIVKDSPAPVGSAGAISVALDDEDQALSNPDADPLSCQNFEETPLGELEAASQGNVLDVTFPFLRTAEECKAAAETILAFSKERGTTVALTLGPSADVKLGQSYGGGIINNINYSYTDSSAYTIQVTVGSAFNTVGSFNGSAWQRRTQDEDRNGYVTWSAGDTVNYQVYVQGLGYFSAINTTHNIWLPGDRVQVSVRSILQES